MIAAADRLIEIGIVLTKFVSMPIVLVVLFAVICKLAKDGRGQGGSKVGGPIRRNRPGRLAQDFGKLNQG